MDRKKINISLVIPVFNSQKSVIEQVNNCTDVLKECANKYNVFISDDKSTDETGHLLFKNFNKRKDVKISFNRKKIGFTKNTLKLYEKADLDYVFLFKANGNWNAKDIEKIVKKCIDTKSDVVIGVRKKKLGYGVFRKLASSIYNFVPQLFFGVKTIDAGGIKILRKSILPRKFSSSGKFFEAEMIIKAIKSAKKVSFVEVAYKSQKNKSINSFKDSIIAFKDIFKLWLGGV